MDYRHHLRNLRENASLTVATLAGRAGLSVDDLAAIEDGRRGTAVQELVALAQALGVRTEEVLFGPPEPVRMNCDPEVGAEALAFAHSVIDDYFAVEALAGGGRRDSSVRRS